MPRPSIDDLFDRLLNDANVRNAFIADREHVLRDYDLNSDQLAELRNFDTSSLPLDIARPALGSNRGAKYV